MRLIERLEDHQRLDYLLEFLEPPSGGRSAGTRMKKKKSKDKARYEVPETTDLLIDVDKGEFFFCSDPTKHDWNLRLTVSSPTSSS